MPVGSSPFVHIREFDPAVTTAPGDDRPRDPTRLDPTRLDTAHLDTAELRRRAQDAARRWVDDGETVSTVAEYAQYLDELVTRASH
jgi:hypothetical protein